VIEKVHSGYARKERFQSRENYRSSDCGMKVPIPTPKPSGYRHVSYDPKAIVSALGVL
jgi:hypothetical protein